MKKLAPLLVILVLVAAIAILVVSRANQVQLVTVYKGNTKQEPVEIVLNHFQGSQCGMTITQLQDSAQAAAPDGNTRFFDDVGCLALWLGDNSQRDEMVLWVYTRDTKEWLDGRVAWYSRTDSTIMNYGYAAYRENQENREGRISFAEMYVKMLRGEHLNNPQTREELLGDH
jgi:copper chaperone NosL